YGHPAVIGGGWDIETALPTARYLERGPIAAIATAAPNPLRDLVRDPPRIGKTVGFAVWQGSLNILTQVEAILTFTPLLAWLRALGVLAVYVLLRATLGLRRAPALLGAALTSAGALLLWIGYFNFEKQIDAWPLIPLGLLIGVAAVEQLAGGDKETRRRGDKESVSNLPLSQSPGLLVSQSRVALLAAITLAALGIAYYPALTLWVPLAAGLAVAILIEHARERRAIPRLLLATFALATLTAIVAAPAILDYWHGFAYRYNEQLTTLGVFFYIPTTAILGLTPYLHGQTEPAPLSFWALAGLAAFGLLALAGLLFPTNDERRTTNDRPAEPPSSFVLRPSSSARLRWWGMLLGALAYLAWLRWWQQYPYAYLKGAAYAGFVFMGLAAAGWQALAARIPWRARMIAALAPLVLSIPIVASQAQIVSRHWDAPGLYPADVPALLDLRARIPAGSTVTLADDGRTAGVTSGLAAYALDHTTVWGHVKTGYTSSTSGLPDAIGEYALLPIGEDPTLYGYGVPIWQGGSYALYQRPAGVLAQLRPEYILAPGQSLALAASAQHLALSADSLPAGQSRRLDLVVAALHEATLSLDATTFALPAGGARLQIAALATGPAHVIRNSGTTPILLRSVTLAEIDGASGDTVTPLRSALVARANASADGQSIITTLETLLPNGGPLTLALDIWDRERALHYGWYGVELGVGAGVQTTTFK
ncbi:MAG: hypothetical protein M3R61_20120, partial [Chloroflexota bacterium]|nr:hypothetical protein [Chloroflexota bacterium]